MEAQTMHTLFTANQRSSPTAQVFLDSTLLNFCSLESKRITQRDLFSCTGCATKDGLKHNNGSIHLTKNTNWTKDEVYERAVGLHTSCSVSTFFHQEPRVRFSSPPGSGDSGVDFGKKVPSQTSLGKGNFKS